MWLTECRPALLAGVQLGAEEEASMGESWLLHYNLSLPESVRPGHCKSASIADGKRAPARPRQMLCSVICARTAEAGRHMQFFANEGL